MSARLQPAVAAPPEPDPVETRRAQTIERDLASGRLREAVVEAEAAVRRFPDSGLLRLRLGQTDLCRSIEQSRAQSELFQDALLARRVAGVVHSLELPPANADERVIAHQARMRESLLTAANRTALWQFQSDVLRRLDESRPALTARAQALSEALIALREARRRGESSTELDLTELWARAMAVVFRSEAETLALPPSSLGVADPLEGHVEAVRASLSPFSRDSAERLARDAAELAERRGTDARAVAGAADLLMVAAWVTSASCPVHRLSKMLLDHRWLPGKNGDRFFSGWAGAKPRQEAAQAFQRLTQEKAPEAWPSPEPLAVRLYTRACDLDEKGALPFLRPRAYLLTLPFDRERARALLNTERKARSRSAVTSLEEARATLLLDDDGPGGMAQVREGIQGANFPRSLFVAVPDVLRPSLRQLPVLLWWHRDYLPGFGWLFQTLEEIQRPPSIRDNQIVALPDADRETQLSMLRLRLGLAERLITAPDVADAVEGMRQKGRVLSELKRWEPVMTAAERVTLERKRQELGQQAAAPRASDHVLVLTDRGLSVGSSPDLSGSDSLLPPGRYEGFLRLQPDGFSMMSGAVVVSH